MVCGDFVLVSWTPRTGFNQRRKKRGETRHLFSRIRFRARTKKMGCLSCMHFMVFCFFGETRPHLGSPNLGAWYSFFSHPTPPFPPSFVTIPSFVGGSERRWRLRNRSSPTKRRGSRGDGIFSGSPNFGSANSAQNFGQNLWRNCGRLCDKQQRSRKKRKDFATVLLYTKIKFCILIRLFLLSISIKLKKPGWQVLLLQVHEVVCALVQKTLINSNFPPPVSHSFVSPFLLPTIPFSSTIPGEVFLNCSDGT